MLETIREYRRGVPGSPTAVPPPRRPTPLYYLSLSDRLRTTARRRSGSWRGSTRRWTTCAAAFDRSIAGGDDDTALALAGSVDRTGTSAATTGGLRPHRPALGTRCRPAALRARAAARCRCSPIGSANWTMPSYSPPAASSSPQRHEASPRPTSATTCSDHRAGQQRPHRRRRYLERAHTIAADLDRDKTRAHANEPGRPGHDLGDDALDAGSGNATSAAPCLPGWSSTPDGALEPSLDRGPPRRCQRPVHPPQELAEKAGSPLYVAIALVGLPRCSRPGERRPGSIPAPTRRRRPRGGRNRLTGIDADAYRDAEKLRSQGVDDITTRRGMDEDNNDQSDGRGKLRVATVDNR